LAASEKLRHNMGDYNREKTIQKFSIHQMAEEYKQLFSRVKKKAIHGEK
jgi:hypothetical protein